jgi:hypothetical protein
MQSKERCVYEIYKDNPKPNDGWMWWKNSSGIDAILNLWAYFNKAQNKPISIETENLNNGFTEMFVVFFFLEIFDVLANQIL